MSIDLCLNRRSFSPGSIQATTPRARIHCPCDFPTALVSIPSNERRLERASRGHVGNDGGRNGAAGEIRLRDSHGQGKSAPRPRSAITSSTSREPSRQKSKAKKSGTPSGRFPTGRRRWWPTFGHADRPLRLARLGRHCHRGDPQPGANSSHLISSVTGVLTAGRSHRETPSSRSTGDRRCVRSASAWRRSPSPRHVPRGSQSGRRGRRPCAHKSPPSRFS